MGTPSLKEKDVRTKMRIPSHASSLLRFLLLPAAILSLTSHPSMAQDSNSGMELHANGRATAAEVGLPAYPGAKLYKEPGSDSGAVDMGVTFGNFHFRIVAASYLTDATPAQVLDYYRKPLARYGDVLECDHGKPVGAVSVAHGGLTCSDGGEANVKVNGKESSSDDHELRAGTPQRFRIVGIGEKQGNSTRFGLVYVELPKDSDSNDKSD
jgi:hypothetical protein